MLNPSRTPGPDDEAFDEAYRRMLAARERIGRMFSPEAMANADPDIPEVVGIHTPEVMRDVRKRRAAG